MCVNPLDVLRRGCACFVFLAFRRPESVFLGLEEISQCPAVAGVGPLAGEPAADGLGVYAEVCGHVDLGESGRGQCLAQCSVHVGALRGAGNRR
ncbi:hypothetical protein A9R04_26065 [Nocardiopsis dassonvillei]|nr:hypothetical protein A9R04_26065 [Nocardiopsis dassonvillei]